jgi:hypothetical protein
MPVFSPDGSKIMFNSLELERCYRRVVPLEKLLR